MDGLLGEFENLKISALSKSKSINKYVHNVTIGPNSTTLENLSNDTPEARKYEKQKVNNGVKTPITNNKRTSLGKILTEIEAQVKDEIATSVRSRLEKIQDASKALDARVKSEWINKQKMLIAQSQEQEELMMKVLEEHDRKAFDHLQQLQIQQQKQAEERNKRNLELQMKEKYRRELIQIFESIQKQQLAFRILYQDIVINLKESNVPTIIKDPRKFSTISAVSTKLKALLENMEKIKEVCKAQTSELTNKNSTNEQIVQSNVVAKANLEIAIILITEAAKLKETLLIFLATCKEDEIKQNVPQTQTAQPPSPVQETKFPPHIISASTTVTDSPRQMSVPVSTFTLIPQQQQQQQQQTLQQQQQQQQQQLQHAPQKETVNKTSITTVELFANKNALKEYASIQQFLENYKKNFADLVNDPSLKQFRFHCQKAVNTPLNAISTVNSQHMLDKYNRLANLLRGNTVEAAGTTVCSSQHPQGIAFCTDLLARKFVLQGDLLISRNPESAHCYAAVLIALWHDFPDFGRLVLAYFYETVPYLVPFYPPRLAGQTDQDYYVSLGYNYVDGVVEEQDKFLKRMAGTMRLYAALISSRLKRGQQGPHPHGLLHGWKWVANVLNIEPRSDITAALLFEFLEVTGSSMQMAYRNQFQKLLTYINDVYFEKMQKIDSGGSVTRLQIFLQKVKKANGQIEPPKGRLPENFW